MAAVQSHGILWSPEQDVFPRRPSAQAPSLASKHSRSTMSQHRAGAGESLRPAPIDAHNAAPTPQSRYHSGIHTVWRSRRAREP